MREENYLIFDPEDYLLDYKDCTQACIGLYGDYKLNQLQEDVIKLCNGKRTLNEIWECIHQLYQVENDEKHYTAFQNMILKLLSHNIIQESEQAQKKEIVIRKFGEKGKTYPAWIICELTNCCNFLCPHCYKEARNQGVFLEFEKFQRMAFEFAGKVPNFVLTGGEALIHPHINEILKISTDNFETSLLTNGYLLNKIEIELLKRLRRIQISLYGYDDESYYHFTKIKNGFTEMKKSFQNLKKCSGLEMLLTLVLTKKNINKIERYIDGAIELGSPAIAFGLTFPVGRANDSDEIFLFDEKESLQIFQIVNELREQYKGKICIMPFNNQQNYIPLNQSGFGCTAGKKNIVIGEKGMVRPCNMLPAQVFSEYTLEDYIEDVKNGREKNYEFDLLNFRNYMEQNGRKAEDMKCAGFCHIR